MVSQCFAVSLSWELTFWHGPMKRITVHRQPKGSFGFSGSLGISLWPKMYTNLTGSSVADECWRIIRCVIEFTCVFTCFKRLLSRNTKASGHHVFFVAQLPTDVPHSKYCEQMCVTIPELRIAAKLPGGNEWLHPFLVEVSFLVHFGLLSLNLKVILLWPSKSEPWHGNATFHLAAGPLNVFNLAKPHG